MQFRTEYIPPKDEAGLISHRSVIWSIGSCFAAEAGARMKADGFDILVNPLGTLYNPESIRRSVEAVVKGKVYTPADFFPHEGRYHSYDFHSSFSRATAEESAEHANRVLSQLRESLPRLTTVILTLGSARCFRLADSGITVANCHKQPASLFSTCDLTLEECQRAISDTIAMLREAAPSLRDIILTVSPIRHKAYGFHTDRLSKARLLLACDNIVTAGGYGARYFPAYEIMNDDLRDYRFYAADMVHPSEVAVDYIYEMFGRTYYTDETRREAATHRREYLRSLHRDRSAAASPIPPTTTSDDSL